MVMVMVSCFDTGVYNLGGNKNVCLFLTCLELVGTD